MDNMILIAMTFSSLYFSLVRSSVFEDLGLFSEGYLAALRGRLHYKISRSKWTIFYTHKAMIACKIGGTFKKWSPKIDLYGDTQ